MACSNRGGDRVDTRRRRRERGFPSERVRKDSLDRLGRKSERETHGWMGRWWEGVGTVCRGGMGSAGNHARAHRPLVGSAGLVLIQRQPSPSTTRMKTPSLSRSSCMLGGRLASPIVCLNAGRASRAVSSASTGRASSSTRTIELSSSVREAIDQDDGLQQVLQDEHIGPLLARLGKDLPGKSTDRRVGIHRP